MMRFNKSISRVTFAFGAGVNPNAPRLKDPENPDMRDKMQLPKTEYERSFKYEQSKERRAFSLYNVFNLLPYPLFNPATPWQKISVDLLQTIKLSLLPTIYICPNSLPMGFQSLTP